MNRVDLAVIGIVAISAIPGVSRGVLARFGTMLPHSRQVSPEGRALGRRPVRH